MAGAVSTAGRNTAGLDLDPQASVHVRSTAPCLYPCQPTSGDIGEANQPQGGKGGPSPLLRFLGGGRGFWGERSEAQNVGHLTNTQQPRICPTSGPVFAELGHHLTPGLDTITPESPPARPPPESAPSSSPLCLLSLPAGAWPGVRPRLAARANSPACKPVFPRLFGGGSSVSKKPNEIKAQG